MSDIVERARLVQRVNAHWSDSICECEECTEERFGLITPMADEIESLRSRLSDAEREARVLVVAMADQFGAPDNWKPLPDAAGMITQISNMVAGLRARLVEAERLLRICTDGREAYIKSVNTFLEITKFLGTADSDEWPTREEAEKRAAELMAIGRATLAAADSADDEWHCSQYPGCECFAGCREKALEAAP
jgi:hypothetical protein